MDYSNILFYIFAVGALFSGLMVVGSRNPVHAVFFLILTFGFAAGLVLLLNVEFLALIFIIVYVGAIAVLFLFVVMMLNIRYVELNESRIKYLPIAGVIGLIFIIEIIYLINKVFREGQYDIYGYINWIDSLDGVSNISALGNVLYTYYVYYFMVAGFILLVAMIGSIVLTLHHNLNVKRQEVYKQVGRDYLETVIKKN